MSDSPSDKLSYSKPLTDEESKVLSSIDTEPEAVEQVLILLEREFSLYLLSKTQLERDLSLKRLMIFEKVFNKISPQIFLKRIPSLEIPIREGVQDTDAILNNTSECTPDSLRKIPYLSDLLSLKSITGSSFQDMLESEESEKIPWLRWIYFSKSLSVPQQRASFRKSPKASVLSG